MLNCNKYLCHYETRCDHTEIDPEMVKQFRKDFIFSVLSVTAHYV